MAITIGSSNISSLQAQKSLSDATSKVADAYQQLSSGLRINQASDDAAGLAIASSLTAKSRVYDVGVRNVNDAVSASNIAQGALNALKGISERQLELAEQAANGTYSSTQRKAINTEANALVDEYNRITSSTTFNGLSLFDPSLGSVLIQAGNSTLKEGFSDALARVQATGSFSAAATSVIGGTGSTVVLSADFNGDGKMDLVTSDSTSNDVSIFLGNGDGTFGQAKTYKANATTMSLADFNGDGKSDILTAVGNGGLLNILINNGDGTFKAATTILDANIFGNTAATGDVNGDGIIDIVDTGSSISHGNVFTFLGNGDGTFKSSSPATSAIQDIAIALADVNGDGLLDAVSSGSTSVGEIFIGNGDGTFKAYRTSNLGAVPTALSLGDLNGDGIADVVIASSASNFIGISFGNGDGSFKAAVTFTNSSGHVTQETTSDIDGDGSLDLLVTDSTANVVNLYINNGDGTFQAAKSFHSGGTGTSAVATADVTGDGVQDVIALDATSSDVSTLVGGATLTSNSAVLNLKTQASALRAQTTINGNLSRIEAQLGSLGATGSRFQTALNNLQVQSQNFTASASRIQDADIAQESSILVRTQILQQSAASVLAQANQQPALALKLLG